MKATRMHSVLRKGGALFASLFLALTAEALMPHTSQNIALTYGWNAVYVQVSPEQTADALFAAWPVDHVGVYDPASFLATRQFSANWTSQGLPNEAMAAWYREAPEASTLKSVPAGSVLVTFCKTDSYLATLYGAPAAPRTTWHVTDTNTVHNFVGFSVSQATDIAAYLEGSPCENVKSLAYYRIVGDDPNASPQSLEVRTWNSTVADGDVLLLPSDKISDWSGVLHVSPLNGVDFGQSANKAALSIRNDGTTNRTVRIELARAINHADLFFNSALLPMYLFFRDMDVAITNAAWRMGNEREPYYGMAFYKKLSPGETWHVEVGLDRNGFQAGDRQKGLPFGALLKITEDTAAHAQVIVPISGETSGEEASDWQNGLWVADVEFDAIQMVAQKWVIESNDWENVEITTNVSENAEITTNVSENAVSVTTNIEQVVLVTTNAVDTALGASTPTGGKFKLRLPIHRDRGGTTRLLQRVVLAGDVAADGTFDYKLYAGTVSPPDTAKTLTRISAVCLPTETPVIEASEENLWTNFYDNGKNTAKFEFTVGAYGATSLLRHPYHPQHDGLRWDFVTHAPNGDDVYNYKSDVKPETFSVKNEIKLEITLGQGVEPWNPEESFNGTCEWTLSGLRHDGKIVVSGPMVLRRISPNAQLMLK